jgi:hypothetical protein
MLIAREGAAQAIAVRERLGHHARTARAEVLTPGEHDRVGAIPMLRWIVGTPSSANWRIRSTAVCAQPPSLRT